MRRQGQDVMQVNLAGIRRDIMNLAHNYSNAQVISNVLYYLILYVTIYIYSIVNLKKNDSDDKMVHLANKITQSSQLSTDISINITTNMPITRKIVK